MRKSGGRPHRGQNRTFSTPTQSERKGPCSANCREGLLHFVVHTACPRNISEIHFCVDVNVFNIHIFMANGRHADSLIKMIRKGNNTCQPSFHPKMGTTVTVYMLPGDVLYSTHIQKVGANQCFAPIVCQKQSVLHSSYVVLSSYLDRAVFTAWLFRHNQNQVKPGDQN